MAAIISTSASASCNPITFFAKVGSEWVTKGQTVAQANNAVAGIARGIFERQFRYLVQKCNDTLVDPTMRKYVNRFLIAMAIVLKILYS